jgi:hypothetical protein
MAVVAGEEEEWRQWQRATMRVVVLDNIDNDDCNGAMDSDYEGDNGDGAMDVYNDGDDDDDIDGDGAIDNNDDDNDSDDNVVVQTPAHRRRRRHWHRILSRGKGQGNKIISSFICC